MSEFSHIHPDFQHIMALSAKDRLTFLDELDGLATILRG